MPVSVMSSADVCAGYEVYITITCIYVKYTVILYSCKKKGIFQMKKVLFFCLKIDYGSTLEPPRYHL